MNNNSKNNEFPYHTIRVSDQAYKLLVNKRKEMYNRIKSSSPPSFSDVVVYVIVGLPGD